MEWVVVSDDCYGPVSDSKGEITGKVWMASREGKSYQHEYKDDVFVGYYDTCGGYISEEFSGDVFAIARCEFPEFPKELLECK